MRSDRLVAIMLLLQARGQMPAVELASNLEVSVRTIMRDVEALSAAGVPVYTVRGPLGGVALTPGYRTDVTGLTAEESRALLVLLTGPARADLGLGLGEAIGSALRKLMAALPDQQRPGAELASRRILIDPVRWRSAARPSGHLDTLNEASFSGRRVRVRYQHGRDASVRTYTLDPYGLVSKAGVWYLAADHRGEPHLFRADRMLASAVLDATARLRDGVELADVWEALRREIEDSPGQFPVTVRVRRGVLGRFLLLHESDLAEPPPPLGDDQDDIELRLRFRAPAAAHLLLAFGTDVTVLDPPELRRRLARVASEVAASYAETGSLRLADHVPHTNPGRPPALLDGSYICRPSATRRSITATGIASTYARAYGLSRISQTALWIISPLDGADRGRIGRRWVPRVRAGAGARMEGYSVQRWRGGRGRAAVFSHSGGHRPG